MIIHILITIVFYIILMLVSTNLVGFFVRGLFVNPDLDKLKTTVEGNEFIKEEIKKYERSGKLANAIAFLLIVVYLYLTFHFGNIGVTMIAVIFMITRLPDLLWEIKSGQKISIYSMPKNTLSFITNFLMWASLPALYYFLYHF
ncbi:MAG TPA: hypothetical protein P5083_01495 [Candidatus Paceibacterota bacterium]|nr:hypothetical protein [Candidatus Paceibacterota bacterium]